MMAENYLAGPLSGEDLLIQTCAADNETVHQQPKDYSMYLNVLSIYFISLTILVLTFFHTELKRTKADQGEVKKQDAFTVSHNFLLSYDYKEDDIDCQCFKGDQFFFESMPNIVRRKIQEPKWKKYEED